MDLLATAVLLAIAIAMTAVAVLLALPLLAAAAVGVDHDRRLNREAEAPGDWTARGLRETVDGFVGTLDGRPVRVRTSGLGALKTWSLELDLHRTELEVVTGTVLSRAWETGDPKFDGAFAARSAPETLGDLTDQARARLCALVGPSVRVHVVAGHLEVMVSTPAALEALLDAALEAADALDDLRATQPEDRLAARAASDPCGPVRARALALLRARDPERAEEVTAPVDAEACHPELALEVAMLRSDIDTVVQLAGSPVDLSIRERATRAVVLHGEPGRCLALAERLAAAGDPVLDRLAADAAAGAGALGEPLLIALLGRSRVDTVCHVADRLAVVGTVAAVPDLRMWLERATGRPRQHLRDAVSAIQGRVNAGGGEVSLLAEGDATGRLSAAQQARRGALSDKGSG